MKRSAIVPLCLAASCAGESQPDATAILAPLANSGVQGTIEFTLTHEGEIRVNADVTGLIPGKHGMHVHEWGDCSAVDGISAGGHFNPDGVEHGWPGAPVHHPGDFGNLEADESGRATLSLLTTGLSLADDPYNMLGRAVIVHEKADDFSQPTGNAGGRLACGVINVAGGASSPVLQPREFGFTCIEMQAGEGVEGDPFAGTQKIKARMTYEPCLTAYYTKKHPEQRADGPADAGGATFGEWKDRLCSEPVERRIDCEVDSFEQTLNADAELYNMAITYSIFDATTIAGKRLLWGPGPLESTAECEAGLGPFVRFVALADLQGLDDAGNTLWRLQSFGPTQRGMIQETATACLQVFVEPV